MAKNKVKDSEVSTVEIVKSVQYNDIIDKIKSIKNGTLFRLKYKTELPMKAEFSKRGFKVVKIVETTTRTGVKYGNIKNVVKSIVSKAKSSDKSNYEWVIPNKIRFNRNTGNTYLYTAPISAGCNKNTLYEIYIPCPAGITSDYTPWVYISEDNLKALGIIQDSYWTKSDRPINDINLNNIISIG
jgi:hypothetical protein